MITIYGAKVIDEDDLFEKNGRPKNVCEFASIEKENIFRDLRDVILPIKFEESYKSTELDLSFIPLELIEEYVLYRSVQKSAEIAISCMTKTQSISDAQLLVENAYKKLQEKISQYEYGDKKIADQLCITYIFNSQSEIKDICLSLPRKVFEFINKPIMYECCICKNKEYTNDLPDNMFYCISRNKIKYYCSKCSENIEKAVHVGDNFK